MPWFAIAIISYIVLLRMMLYFDGVNFLSYRTDQYNSLIVFTVTTIVSSIILAFVFCFGIIATVITSGIIGLLSAFINQRTAQ